MDNTDLWLAMRQTKYNRTLNSIQQILKSPDADPLAMVSESFTEIVAAQHAVTGTLWIHQRYGDGLIHPVAVYKGNLPEGFTIKVGEGIAGKSIQDAKGFIIADCQNDPRWAGKADAKTGFVTRSMLCIPLVTKDGAIGCIQIINKEDGMLFDNTDFEFATQLTNGVTNLFVERNLTTKLQTGDKIINRATLDDVVEADSTEKALSVIEQMNIYKKLSPRKQKRMVKLVLKVRALAIEALNTTEEND